MNAEFAINSPAFPCNPRPFANRIKQLLAVEHAEGGPKIMIRNERVRSCLLILLQMSYGQMDRVKCSNFDEATKPVTDDPEYAAEQINTLCTSDSGAIKSGKAQAYLNTLLLMSFGVDAVVDSYTEAVDQSMPLMRAHQAVEDGLVVHQSLIAVADKGYLRCNWMMDCCTLVPRDVEWVSDMKHASRLKGEFITSALRWCCETMGDDCPVKEMPLISTYVHPDLRKPAPSDSNTLYGREWVKVVGTINSGAVGEVVKSVEDYYEIRTADGQKLTVRKADTILTSPVGQNLDVIA